MPIKKIADVRSVYCMPEHLHWVRGQLMAKLRRDITWTEFGRMMDIKPRIMEYLKHNKRPGGRTIVRKLIEGARKYDVILHLSDFYLDDPNQEAAQTWRRWKDYKT